MISLFFSFLSIRFRVKIQHTDGVHLKCNSDQDQGLIWISNTTGKSKAHYGSKALGALNHNLIIELDFHFPHHQLFPVSQRPQLIYSLSLRASLHAHRRCSLSHSLTDFEELLFLLVREKWYGSEVESIYLQYVDVCQRMGRDPRDCLEPSRRFFSFGSDQTFTEDEKEKIHNQALSDEDEDDDGEQKKSRENENLNDPLGYYKVRIQVTFLCS